MTQTNFRNLPTAVPINGSEIVPVDQLQGTQFVTCQTTASAVASVIPFNTVTNSMLGNAGAFTIKSNATGSTGTVGDNSISTVLDAMLSSTQGVILYRGANTWQSLAPGVSGQVLQTKGVNANPLWASTGGVGTVTQINTGAGLSGGPITASGTLSSIQVVNPQTGASYAFLLSDQAKLVTFNNAGATSVSLMSASTLGNGWWVDVQNIGTGSVTITPSGSTINGASSLSIPSGTGYRIVSDGSNYQIRGSGTSAITLTGDVNGSGSGSIATTVGAIGGQTVVLGGPLTTLGAFSTTLTTSAATNLTLPTSGTVTALGNATTGSGSVVLATSPTLVTPTIGVATATSINGNTITTGTGTLTLGTSKVLTANNTITMAGTDGVSVNFGAGLTIASGKTLTNNNNLTFTGVDGSSVDFGSGGSVLYTNVTTLSSLTSIGTIGTGTWQGTVVGPTYGGTGINNGSKTLTLGGSLATSGAFASTFTMTAPTSVTFPTSGTLANTSVATLSSLSSIGTISTGTWNGTVIGATYGGTGINNGSSTLTLGGSLTTSGAFTSTFTMTAPTSVTFPTTGTLATQTGVTDGSSAAAGNIGERIGVTWSTVSLTTTVTVNAATMSLTAGDWDVYLSTDFSPNAANITSTQCGISTGSLTFASSTTDGYPIALLTNGAGTNGHTILHVTWRLNISTTTTVYSLANAVFAGTCTTSGAMYARRRR